MTGILARLISWLAGKLVIYAVILGLLLAVFVVKVVPPMVVKYHEKELEKAITGLSESRALVGELAERVKILDTDIQQRMSELKELEQKRRGMEEIMERIMNLFRKKEVAAEKAKLEKQERELRAEIRSFSKEKQQLQIEGGESEEELKQREVLRDEKERQLREIQEMRETFDDLMRNQLRVMAVNALMILAAIIVIPFLWKLAAYYVIAPIAQTSKPILLGVDHPAADAIITTESHPAQRIELGTDEVMLTKVDYLQGSMGTFEKGTKWIMDWKYPFSSMAAGLYILTRIKNVAEAPGMITLSTQVDATEELSVVEIPAGRSLVFRPHFLVAVAHPIGQAPRIRSKWIFRKLHAWVNLQFRYMTIEGPVKLVFSAQRGIQVESVLPIHPGRRVNSKLTVAFSPHLNFSPKRAETFVAYLRSKNALFDDFFQGSGLVIQQQVTGGKKNPVARLWEGIFGAIGRVLGI
ncbi:hypothetical protein ACFSSA_06140 [Luteolibacter algae]|uniref:Uncharacterized protein n=1 Tax=Luteolibacter algae TaxID=454151 RepID=A0ABW5D6Q0_9BACT